MATPLDQLLKDSWHFFKRAFVPIFMGALIFGILLGIGQSLVGERMWKETGVMLQELGVEKTTIDDLSKRIAAGDQSAVEEFAKRLQAVQEQQAKDGVSEESAKVILGGSVRFLKVMGAASVLMWAITVIASSFYLILALGSQTEFSPVLKRAFGVVIPLFGLSLWVAARSFVWIPFIGPLIAIALLPRFVCAPVILIDERKGVFESAKLSYARTKGYWGKIMGNCIVAGVGAFIAGFVVTLVIGILGVKISAAFAPVVNMLVTAFLTIFLVKLSLAIMKHPKAA